MADESAQSDRVAELKRKMQEAAARNKAAADASPASPPPQAPAASAPAAAAAPPVSPAPAQAPVADLAPVAQVDTPAEAAIAVLAETEPVAVEAAPAASVPPAVSVPTTVDVPPEVDLAILNAVAAGVVMPAHTGSNGASAAVLPANVAEVVESNAEALAERQMNRREFLTYSFAGAAGLVVAFTGFAIFEFMYPRFRAGEFGGVFFIPASEIPAVGAPPVPKTDGKFWLVNSEEEGPKALYMVCTHLGCLYKWATSTARFECPCHGSKFTADGYYIEGPAPRSLDHFVTTVEGDVLMVDTGAKITGTPSSVSPAKTA